MSRHDRFCSSGKLNYTYYTTVGTLQGKDNSLYAVVPVLKGRETYILEFLFSSKLPYIAAKCGEAGLVQDL